MSLFSNPVVNAPSLITASPGFRVTLSNESAYTTLFTSELLAFSETFPSKSLLALFKAFKILLLFSLSPAKIMIFLLFFRYSFILSSKSFTSPLIRLISFVLKSFFKVSCSYKFTVSLNSNLYSFIFFKDSGTAFSFSTKAFIKFSFSFCIASTLCFIFSGSSKNTIKLGM